MRSVKFLNFGNPNNSIFVKTNGKGCEEVFGLVQTFIINLAFVITIATGKKVSCY